MNLDTDRWAVLSGVESKDTNGTAESLNESITMGMAGPGFSQAPAQHQSVPASDESEELRRLRLVIREEVQAVISELQAEKDLRDVANIAGTKSISATMGFSGPGFGGQQSKSTPDSNTSRRGPTAGLIPGLGF